MRASGNIHSNTKLHSKFSTFERSICNVFTTFYKDVRHRKTNIPDLLFIKPLIIKFIQIFLCMGQQDIIIVQSVLMLHQLCLWARAQSLDYLWLEVRRSNLRAQKLYQDYGMQQVGERKAYYPTEEGAHEDALVLTYQLRQ